MIQYVLRIVRRVFGTYQLEQRLKHQHLQLQKVLSILAHSVVDPQVVKSGSTYRRCSELKSLLAPKDIQGVGYVRFGNVGDGGYVMVADIDGSRIAYSLGIASDVSWDKDVATRGIDIYMYDHTIARLPEDHPRFHFHRIGVTGQSDTLNMRCLGDLIAENGHENEENMLLKMDIEGSEWDVFTELSTETLQQFSQIAVELHGLTDLADDVQYQRMVESLRHLNSSHQCVHVHANTCDLFLEGGATPIWIGDLVLPATIEATFVNRQRFGHRLVPNGRVFPTELDAPNFSGHADLYLGSF